MIETSSFRNRARNALLAIRLFRNFPSFYLHYFGLLQDPVTLYRLRNGLKLKIRNRSADFRVIREIWVAGDYEPAGFQIGYNDTVLDVGAQIGVFTLLAAHRARGGRVHAFEPMPDNADLLEENLRLNAISHARVFRLAVAAQAGTHDFFVSGYNTGGHSLYVRKGTVQRISVETASLPDHIRQHRLDRVDLLKLDCEGAEKEILGACPPDVLNRIHRIILETHPDLGSTPDYARSFLEARGFEVVVNRDLVYARRP
jgi:FkbM family methyltransferase